ncbi:MAG: CvpA family protein [Blautia sp.]|nr:CvpA family protein [Blautia sp.]
MSWTYLGLIVGVWMILSIGIGFYRGFIKEAVSMAFLVLSFAVVWFVNPTVSSFIEKHTPVYEKVYETCQDFVQDTAGSAVSMNGAQQEAFLENLNLPKFLTDALAKNNTAEMYKTLGVDKFIDYIAAYLASLAVHIVAFAASFLLAVLLLRILSFALDLFSRLPVISGINRLAGGVLGAAKCLVFIWIAMMIIAVLYDSGIGKKAMELIRSDTLLNFLFNNNMLAKWLISLTKM